MRDGIYLISPKGSNDPVIAVFTDWVEGEDWVKYSQWGFHELEMTKMIDGGDSKFIGSRVFVPWTNGE